MDGRFEVPEARGTPGEEAWFNARKKFYQEVFALGEPVWQYTPDPVTNSNLSPEIRVYQLRPSTSRAAPN